MKRALLSGIRLYQAYLSPLKTVRCPYIPSCSSYGYEAVKRHGAFFGSLLAIYRIIRCNPFSKGGIDPVPERLFLGRRVRMRYEGARGTE